MTSYQNPPDSLPSSNLTPDEQKTLKRLKSHENVAILPADKGRVTVVMNKTDYNDKMGAFVKDKQTNEYLNETRRPHRNANLTQTASD